MRSTGAHVDAAAQIASRHVARTASKEQAAKEDRTE